ncbi:HET-domain-containing protein, partial [Mollisia scopiformis]
MRDENFRPQRLLKVSITGAGILVQLLVTKEIPREVRIQYLTLSYCWGQGDHLRLTKATEETFAEGVPLEDMPKTLLDAVVITARLHYEHLWIDALCIIQDSEQDTKDNILSMGEVYRNSIFTIAALAARGSHEGCFVRRNPLARDEYRVREDSPYTFSHLFEPIGPDTRDPQLAPPLQKRAWVIQERALSPRTLYYGSEMIFWECIQSKASEYEPIMQDLWYAGGQDLKDRSPGVIFHSGMKSVFKLLLDRCKDGTYCDWISYWRKLVRDYTVCQMTKESDKWAAIAGLATEVELVARDESFHGLWKNRLCRELLWYADRPGRRLGTEKPGGQEVKAPSWSWTSVDAIIEWW